MVPTVAGTFSPLRTPLGLDEHGFRSGVIEPMVTAAGKLTSFRDATFAVQLAGISISERQLTRLAHQVGQELIEQRDRKVLAHRRRQLPARCSKIPQAVVVEVDGGRIRTRAAEQKPGVHDAQNKEDKVACLATLKSQTFTEDPQPEPPASLQNARRVQRLVQQMKGQAAEAESTEKPEPNQDSRKPIAKIGAHERCSPQRLLGTCVASMAASESFGPMLAAEAQERHFFEAKKQAFVADGLGYNWTIHRGYFSSFVPIVDFLHVLCYVYAAARAVHEEESSGWSQYLLWLRACWQGRVQDVLTELAEWQGRLGLPPPEKAQTAEERRDPRRVVAEARSYLTNNRERMDYPRYRREGLPQTSSLVESLVGEVNARVKSKQKYWLRPQGAETILQLRAAVLSQDERLTRFFANRPGSPTRRKRKVAS
jgi:hypothetical protein